MTLSARVTGMRITVKSGSRRRARRAHPTASLKRPSPSGSHSDKGDRGALEGTSHSHSRTCLNSAELTPLRVGPLPGVSCLAPPPAPPPPAAPPPHRSSAGHPSGASDLTVGAVVVALRDEHLLQLLPRLLLRVLPLGHTPGHVCGQEQSRAAVTRGKRTRQRSVGTAEAGRGRAPAPHG